MVVIARSPIEPTGKTQDRTALPSTCTVQAPHCAIPQPNFVPVSPKTSRRTHSKGMLAGASTFFSSPLIRRLIMQHLGNGLYCKREHPKRLADCRRESLKRLA